MSKRRDENLNDHPNSDDETTWGQAAHRHFEPNEHEELVTVVVLALADAMNVDPLELRDPPVYECVDVSAIEATFFGIYGTDPSRGSDGSVEFRYTDYLVKVDSDGWVCVYESVETAG